MPLRKFSLDYTEPRHEMPDIHGAGVVEYECNHCEGITVIVVVENEGKGTVPTVEFCPLCGQSNQFEPEIIDGETSGT
jgi:hypothetical protein